MFCRPKCLFMTWRISDCAKISFHLWVEVSLRLTWSSKLSIYPETIKNWTISIKSKDELEICCIHLASIRQSLTLWWTRALVNTKAQVCREWSIILGPPTGMDSQNTSTFCTRFVAEQRKRKYEIAFCPAACLLCLWLHKSTSALILPSTRLFRDPLPVKWGDDTATYRRKEKSASPPARSISWRPQCYLVCSYSHHL